jgi:hypothetical protein
MQTKTCNECKVDKKISSFYKAGRSRLRGKCISCYKNYRKKSDYKPESRWKKYRSGAKRRNLKFEITKAEFSLFEGEPCFYCGGEVLPISLDRVDNDKGYEVDNVVSCCHICNSFKHVFDDKLFLDHVEKIYKYQREKDGK